MDGVKLLTRIRPSEAEGLNLGLPQELQEEPERESSPEGESGEGESPGGISGSDGQQGSTDDGDSTLPDLTIECAPGRMGEGEAVLESR